MAYKGRKLAQLSPADRAARIAHLVATHNTAAVPTKFLTGANAKFARQRLMNERLDTPVVPGDTMTNRDLSREATAATQTQYGPLMASQALQPKQTSDYYAQYLATLKGIQSSQAAQGQQLATTLGNIGAAGQQQAQTENTRVEDQAAQDARNRGAVQDPSLAANAANAAQVTRNIATGAAGTAGVVGQNAANFLGALQAAGGASKLAALNKNTSDALQTKREAGAFKTQYVGKRRSEEATNVATSALANVNADTKKSAAQVARQNARTSRSRAQEAARHNKAQENKGPSASEQKTAADLAFFKKHGYYPPTGAPKKGKGPKGAKPPTGLGSLTPQQENDKATQINTIAGWLQKPPNDDKGKPQTAAQILEKLRTGKNPLGKPISPQILNAAKSLAANQGKGLGPYGIHNAHVEGVHVKGRWKQLPKAKKKRPAGPAGPVS